MSSYLHEAAKNGESQKVARHDSWIHSTKICSKCANISFSLVNDTIPESLIPTENHDMYRGLSVYEHYTSTAHFWLSLKENCHLCILINYALSQGEPNKILRTPDHVIRLVLPYNFSQLIHKSNSDNAVPRIFVVRGSTLGYLQIFSTDNLKVSRWKNPSSIQYLIEKNDKRHVAPWSHYIPDMTATHTGSSSSLRLAADWLDRCVSHGCQSLASQEGSNKFLKGLPKFLLQLGEDGKTSLYEVPSHFNEEYVTLSYSWGYPRHPWGTSRANVEIYKQEILWLPQIYQDAINVTKYLGFRYLWIDALCIIQDDKIQFDEEINNMGNIFANTSLTIAAATGFGVSSGLFASYHPVAQRPCPGTINDLGKDYNVVFTQEFKHEETLLNKRLWVYQEQTLSPRTLEFGSRCLTWRCRMMTIHEPEPFERPANQRPESVLQGGYTPANQVNLLRNWIWKSTDVLPKSQTQDGILSRVWCDAVEKYTARDWSERKDQLPGLAGVQNTFKSITKWTYLAGLWEEDLMQGLTWYKPLRAAYHSKQMTDYSPDIAPSWSWASRPNGPVCFISQNHSEDMHSEASVKLPSNQNNQYLDNDIPIEIEGKTKIVEVVPLIDGSESSPQQGVRDPVVDQGAWTLSIRNLDTGLIVGHLFLDAPLEQLRDKPFNVSTEIPFQITCLLLYEFNDHQEYRLYSNLSLALLPAAGEKDCYRRIGLIFFFGKSWERIKEHSQSRKRELEEEEKSFFLSKKGVKENFWTDKVWLATKLRNDWEKSQVWAASSWRRSIQKRLIII